MQMQISNSMVLSSVFWFLPMGDLWFVVNFGEIDPPKERCHNDTCVSEGDAPPSPLSSPRKMHLGWTQRPGHLNCSRSRA